MKSTPTRRHKIIVVDDEEDIVLAMRGFFASVDRNIDALFTTDPVEVLHLLEEHPTVELIITDIRMPNLSGLDLMVRIQQSHPNIKFIVMTGFSSQQIRMQSLGLGAVRYIEKPFDLEEMSEIVVDILENQQGYSGVVEQMHFADVIQMLALSGRKSTLKVIYQDQEGIVAIDGGTIVHAKTPNNSGIDAFNEIFRWPGGRFSVGPYAKHPKSIMKSWQMLVIDAARISDEMTQSGIVDPPVARGSSTPMNTMDEEDEGEDPFAAFETEVKPELKTTASAPMPPPLAPLQAPPKPMFPKVPPASQRYAFPPPISDEAKVAKDIPTAPPEPAEPSISRTSTKARREENKPVAAPAKRGPDGGKPAFGFYDLLGPVKNALFQLWPESKESVSAKDLNFSSFPSELAFRLDSFLTAENEVLVAELESKVDVHDNTIRKTFDDLRKHLRNARKLERTDWQRLAAQASSEWIGSLQAPEKIVVELAALPNVYLIRLLENGQLDWLDPVFLMLLESAVTRSLDPIAVDEEAKKVIDNLDVEERWEFFLRHLDRISELRSWLGWSNDAYPVPLLVALLQRCREPKVAADIELFATVGISELTIDQINAVHQKEMSRRQDVS